MISTVLFWNLATEEEWRRQRDSFNLLAPEFYI